jgi:hypothetical protein
MKRQQLRKAWGDWKKDNPSKFKEFNSFETDLVRKNRKIKRYEISGLIDTNGEVDEFELNQYLVNTEEPVPVDTFIRLMDRT